MELLISQVGYECDGERAPCCGAAPTSISAATSGCCARRTTTSCWKRRWWRQEASPAGRGRHYWQADFSAFTEPGHWAGAVVTEGAGRLVRSPCHRPGAAREPLPLRRHPLLQGAARQQYCPSTGSRPQGRLFGADQRRDVHGGWFDASGGMSNYLVTSPTPATSIPSRPPGGLVPAQVPGTPGPASRHRQG